MNRDIGTKWMEELQSGRYQKGKGALHRIEGDEVDLGKDKLCCLGVLCRMGIEAGVSMVVTRSPKPHARVIYGESSEFLPDEIRKWAGMKTSVGLTGRTSDAAKDLTRVNDRSETFGPVVETIREHMDVL